MSLSTNKDSSLPSSAKPAMSTAYRATLRETSQPLGDWSLVTEEGGGGASQVLPRATKKGGGVLDVLEGGTTSFEVVLTRGTLVLAPPLNYYVWPDINSFNVNWLSHSQQRERIDETKSYRETKGNIVVIL